MKGISKVPTTQRTGIHVRGWGGEGTHMKILFATATTGEGIQHRGKKKRGFGNAGGRHERGHRSYKKAVERKV